MEPTVGQGIKPAIDFALIVLDLFLLVWSARAAGVINGRREANWPASITLLVMFFIVAVILIFRAN